MCSKKLLQIGRWNWWEPVKADSQAELAMFVGKVVRGYHFGAHYEHHFSTKISETDQGSSIDSTALLSGIR